MRRLRKGADLEEATLDDFVQKFDHISHLMATIPADFRSVAEKFTTAKLVIAGTTWMALVGAGLYLA